MHVDIFHTPTGIAFADLITDGHRETWPVRSVRYYIQGAGGRVATTHPYGGR